METKNIILELRNSHGLSQEELAEKVFVTRQAVSRWETGDTVPNTEASVGYLRGIDQYYFRLAEKSDLPVLRYAP